jgi:hypothetical protein
MSQAERGARTGGAVLVGVPVFVYFVWILDNCARGELLVELHDYLPAFLTNPAFAFLCLCSGLGLLHNAHRRQVAAMLQAHDAARVLTSEGVQYVPTVKPRWIWPVAIVILAALLAAPGLALMFSLAYHGDPPRALVPKPTHIAYQESPPEPSRPEQPLWVIQGPRSAFSFNQRGGITAGIVNMGQPEPTVSVTTENQTDDQGRFVIRVALKTDENIAGPSFRLEFDQTLVNAWPLLSYGNGGQICVCSIFSAGNGPGHNAFSLSISQPVVMPANGEIDVIAVSEKPLKLLRWTRQ